jgi:hypothetical protein
MEETSHSCANKEKKRNSKVFCLAGGPNKKSCTANSGDTPGISMHCFPKDLSVRRQWVRFVRRHRSDSEKYSSRIWLCSAHFDESCFSKCFASNLQGFDSSNTKCFLTRGSVPTIDVVENVEDVNAHSDTNVSAKEKRLVSINVVNLSCYYVSDKLFVYFVIWPFKVSNIKS